MPEPQQDAERVQQDTDRIIKLGDQLGRLLSCPDPDIAALNDSLL